MISMKKYKSLKKLKIILIITDILLGPCSAITKSFLSFVNTSAVIVLTNSTALITFLAILITNKYIAILKIKIDILRDWINVITLVYEKTLKQSILVDKRVEKKLMELKMIHNPYLDTRSEIMTNTQPKMEEIFGDIITKASVSPEQITKLFNFLAKIM